MSLVEAALAPPTAVLLSRLVSRARIHEADTRSVELTGDRDALTSALKQVEGVERSPSSTWLDRRRFSLFVTALPQDGYQAWLSRLYATHPSISSRLETIRDSTSETARSRKKPPAGRQLWRRPVRGCQNPGR